MTKDNDVLKRLFDKAKKMENAGLDRIQALGIAQLEERVLKWPPKWGDNLNFLLYGDFKVPDLVLTYPSLGITVYPEKKVNTVIKGAMTVLEASIKVKEKNVPELINAIKKINLLLGTYTLHQWGNAGCGWWSFLIPGNMAGVVTELTYDGIDRSIACILNLTPKVRRKVEAALFWVREPQNLLLESYKSDVFRIYSSYWNAFECLVEAVNILQPYQTLSKPEKQAQIDKFIQNKNGFLTVEDVQKCYQDIVNPGFVGKASHALNICFGNAGNNYAKECFRLFPKNNRLYDIRNAINHGDFDAENPHELLRIESRLRRLWMINWRIFGCFIPFGAPLDSKQVV